VIHETNKNRGHFFKNNNLGEILKFVHRDPPRILILEESNSRGSFPQEIIICRASHSKKGAAGYFAD
jgi:hypothetical protein